MRLIWDQRDPDVQVVQDLYRRALLFVSRKAEHEDEQLMLQYQLSCTTDDVRRAEFDLYEFHRRACTRPRCRRAARQFAKTAARSF